MREKAVLKLTLAVYTGQGMGRRGISVCSGSGLLESELGGKAAMVN